MIDLDEQVMAQLDGTWKTLREISEGAGEVLSGSGCQRVLDALVASGYGESEKRPGAPMGVVYRRRPVYASDELTKIVDANGKRLSVGCRVKAGDATGTVTRITDPDGDEVDGRGVFYPPLVTVDFGDESDEFSTEWTATGPWDSDSAPHMCADVEVVA